MAGIGAWGGQFVVPIPEVLFYAASRERQKARSFSQSERKR